MPTPIIKGNSSYNEKPYEVAFDPRRGITVRRRYTQAGGDSALVPLEQQARLAGYTTRRLVSPVLSELDITSPEIPQDGSGGPVEDIAVDTWQIVGSELLDTAFSSPRLATEVGPIDRRVCAETIRNGLPANSSPPFVGDGAGGVNAALQLYSELQKGQDSYLVAQYVLRHNTNVSESSGYNVSDDNVLAIYTTAQLLAEVTDGGLWLRPLPNRLEAKINSIYAMPMPAPDDDWYLLGWLKKPSTETAGASNRVDITTDYVLYNWSLLRYDVLL